LTTNWEADLERDVVVVTSKSVAIGSAPQNVAELSLPSVFRSRDEPDQWICYDFVDATIKPTHYTICSSPTGTDNLKSWVIEGSNDGKQWIELDRRIKNPALRRLFEVSRSHRIKMIRLWQTGKNCAGTDVLAISAFEIFGLLIGGVETK
jgi:hypothetical protein